MCLWDSRSEGQINAPIATLVTRLDYPIYAVDIVNRTNKDEDNNISVVTSIAVGGGRDGGFIGIPAYLHDIPH